MSQSGRGGELRANAGPALCAGSSPGRSGKSWNAPIVAPLIKCREQDPGHRQCLAYPSRITLTIRHVPLESFLYPTAVEKAAALGFALVMNHPFVDGNKRIGHAAMETFLVLNGYEIVASTDE